MKGNKIKSTELLIKSSIMVTGEPNPVLFEVKNLKPTVVLKKTGVPQQGQMCMT